MRQEPDESARGFVTRTRNTAIIVGGVIGTALVFLTSRSIGAGFFAGMAVSVINFQLMAVDAFEMVEKTPAKARKFIIGRFVLRYAILFAFLIIIIKKTDYNIFAAFAGLFSVQAVLVAGRIIEAFRPESKTTRD